MCSTTRSENGLFFDDEVSNRALIELLQFIVSFVESFEPEMPQICQWPRNVER